MFSVLPVMLVMTGSNLCSYWLALNKLPIVLSLFVCVMEIINLFFLIYDIFFEIIFLIF